MMLAFLGATLIGLSLGLLGSGGSILTVPVLIYLVGEGQKQAIAESLAIVGLIALVGAVPYALKRLIDWKNVLFFGVPGMLGTFLGAFVGGMIPAVVQLLIFAVVMLLAAIMMFRPAPQEGQSAPRKAWKIGLDGILVGLITGLVGVGGGFLIIPALVLLGGLPMRLAVGTSLVIISMKSGVGFLEYFRGMQESGLSMNFTVIWLFAGIGILGSVLGGHLSRFFSQQRLKQSFAAFLVVIGGYILYVNVPGALQKWHQAQQATQAREAIVPSQGTHPRVVLGVKTS